MFAEHPLPTMSLGAPRWESIEQGDGTMAIVEELKRIGEARATPFAALALVVTLGWISPATADAANAATGERTISGVRISLGEEGRRWTLVPTLLDGKVESFVALREDAPYGENLTAVWYRKIAAADGTESWQTKAFDDQDQSKAIRAVKQALALADSTDESWPVAVAAVAAAEPEPMAKGLLESDALAPLVAELEDPQPIVEMLEDAGWQAAWIGPLEGVALATAEPDAVACSQAVVLAALEQTVMRVESDAPTTLLIEQSECLAAAYPTCVSEGPAGPWIPSIGWDCGPWTLASPTPLTNCRTQCNYTREVSRHRFRKITERNCYTGTLLGSYLQTQYETGRQTAATDVSGATSPIQLQGSCDYLASCPSTPMFAEGEIPTCQPSGGTTVGPWLDP